MVIDPKEKKNEYIPFPRQKFDRMLSHFFKMLKRCTEESRFSAEFIFSVITSLSTKKEREELKVNNLNLKERSPQS